MKLWHALSPLEIEGELKTNLQSGLEQTEALSRFQSFGPNKLPSAKPERLFFIFLRQFQSPLIYILLAAAIFVFALKETIDGFIILFVLLFNAVVGTIQEGKAQNTLLALKKFVETNATVVRNGKEIIVPDTEIVAGDIVILQEGEKVPADCRLILANNLRLDEAALTGESTPVDKIADALKNKDLAVMEQKNMVFKGTHITAGNGRAVVVATGLDTVIGRISKEISAIKTEVPLKTNIRHLSRMIIIVVGIISISLFLLGVSLGEPLQKMFTTVVALAVSIIPEGLPIVLTLVLATGVWRMAKRNALVKRLQAVEALGQTKIIAVDKTGTITKNELVIQKVFVNGKFFEIKGVGYEPKGEIVFEGNVVDPLNHPELLLMGKIAGFCANARVAFFEDEKQWKISGDPTEAGLLVFAEKIGFKKDVLEQEFPLIADIPFDLKTKYHATFHQEGDRKFLTVIGAPESVLSLCEKIWKDGKEEIFSKKEQGEIEAIFHKMSREGLRVLALAIKNNVKTETGQLISGLTLVGFCGMKDALRPEIKESIEQAKEAGIKVVMITGDHKLTAVSIAKEAGIWQEGDEAMTGQEMDGLSEKEFIQKLPKISVFARVTPEHKLKIIQAYKARGEIVAMTGDGVNDAPSLVAADLGVGMGKIGTEVAKEASDIVLLDDNFNTIISAVEEGRSIYKTIKKVILYLFSTSLGETLTIVAALFLGYPLPILPGQIIWLNLVTDGFLDVALAMEPKEEELLKGKWKKSSRYLIDSLMAQRMFVMALPMAIGGLFLFRNYFNTDIMKAWTMALTVLAVFQWFNAWNCRSEEKSIFQMNPFSNKFLIGATIIIICLQVAALYTSFMQKILRTVPLNFSEWLVIIAIAFSIIIIEEARKFIYRKINPVRSPI
ncbi:MAG: HAD-IC family P-type ATPase [Candidatus Terrybacteria bacterium]|nr:HAD-IC family P-type ATPase [Candidatus Terrybacteria bacterium]